MSKSLFFLYDPELGSQEDPQISSFYGIKPYSDTRWNDYYTLQRRISLKTDLGWREDVHFQRILRYADIWTDFPAAGLTLVDAEFKGGDVDQRIDLLYLRDDGGLLPCELKIGGEDKDTHGQLIRYMADLSFQKPDLAFLRQRRKRFLKRLTDEVAIDIHKEKFEKFIKDHKVIDKFIRLLPQTGIIIDEEFPPQLLKTVRFLNSSCGFSIRLLRAECFVAQNWKPDASEYLMRLDFIDVQ